jgi:uncharacterized protein
VSRLVPTVTDPDSRGFFEAAAKGDLVVRFCSRCDQVIHLPRAYCHACGSWDTEFRPVAGFGRLYSWTTVRHPAHPAFEVPYTVVLVELEDVPAVRFVGRLPGVPDLEPGMRMRVTFDRFGEAGETMPNWIPESPASCP